MVKVILFLVLISFRADGMLSQMEMGQARPEPEERSTLQACGDCICDPQLYFDIALLNKTFELTVDKTWTSIVQPEQTAFAPMVYAAAAATNVALIAGVSWSYFRKHKFKEKLD